MALSGPLLEFNNDILEEISCPVCAEPMHPPIRMCLIGHSYCNECDKYLLNCPYCRGQKSTTRNLCLENVYNKLVLPCRFRPEGCTFVCKGDRILQHQEACWYKPVPKQNVISHELSDLEPSDEEDEEISIVNENLALAMLLDSDDDLDFAELLLLSQAIGGADRNNAEDDIESNADEVDGESVVDDEDVENVVNEDDEDDVEFNTETNDYDQIMDTDDEDYQVDDNCDVNIGSDCESDDYEDI